MNAKLKVLASGAWVALQPGLVAAQSQSAPPWEWMGPWHMWGAWGHWWVFPLLMMAVMVLMIVLCGMFMMRGPFGHGRSHADTTSAALQVLNERFAKGEISSEEFEEKRSILVRRV